MNEWQIVATVVAAHALAVASPGPDFAIVLKQAVGAGRAAALWTSLGIGSGIAVHVAYAVVGIALLIANTPWLFTAIQLAGAAYLAWIGFGALRAQPQQASAVDAPANVQAAQPWADFRLGFVTNVLNPKATLFFLALFTTVVGPGTPLWLQLGLGAWLCIATAAWFALVSVLFTGAAARRWFVARAHWIDRGMGVILLALAARIVWVAVAP